MKKMRWWLSLWVGLCIWLPSVYAQSGAQKSVIIGWEPWPPFQNITAGGALPGLDVELTREIFTQAGYTVEYRQAPWSRQLNECEQGKIEFLTSALMVQARERFAWYADPYRTESYQLFVRKEDAASFGITRLSDLIKSNKVIGVLRGSIYSEEYAQLLQNPQFKRHVEEIHLDELNHKKLLAKRIDGFVQEYSVMASVGRKDGFFDRVTPVLRLNETPMHALACKAANKPELVEVFNNGLQAMRKNGSYQKLFEKYKLPNSMF